MKLLIEKETNLTKYIWKTLEFIDEKQTQADNFIFWTLWSDNSEIKTINKTDIPEDWTWNKYFYIDWEFVLNEDYVEPEEEVI